METNRSAKKGTEAVRRMSQSRRICALGEGSSGAIGYEYQKRSEGGLSFGFGLESNAWSFVKT